MSDRLQQIDQEYQRLCMETGALANHVVVCEKQIVDKQARMQELAREAAELRKIQSEHGGYNPTAQAEGSAKSSN